MAELGQYDAAKGSTQERKLAQEWALNPNNPLNQGQVVVAPKGGGSLKKLPSAKAPSGPSAEQRAVNAANAAGRSASSKANQNTKDQAEGQFKLLASFGTQRDIKLSNIQQALQASQDMLLKNYGIALGGLKEAGSDNDKAEADASFSNVSNAVRERAGILDQVASMGAGESDQLRAQLAALRNYSSNQGEVNRSFFDTLRSINSSINSLNSDTGTSRLNLFNQAEGDRESAWSNYYNQTADTWTQIGNIESSNNNVDSAASVAYKKQYGQSADEAAKAAAGSYARQAAGADIYDWSGKGAAEERALNTSNKAATVNLGGKQKKPEGATLRKW